MCGYFRNTLLVWSRLEYPISPLHLLYFIQIEIMLLAQTHYTNIEYHCSIYETF